MADGTENQASDGSSADSPQGSHAPYLEADTGRVARIVAALRKAHAEQAAASSTASSAVGAIAHSTAVAAAVPSAGTTTDTGTDTGTVTAEPYDAPAPRRETSGVKPTRPPVPTLRWNPGARYRASRLADHPVANAPQGTSVQVTSVQAPPAAAPVPGPPAPVPAPPGPPALPAAGPVPAPPALAGRLFRGPARRTAVFEREIWHPVSRSYHVPRDVSEALVTAVERYRKGSISTSGLVRAIGRAHAA
ncbi:hypothetical protein [Promicromonospora sp. NPDC023805]|uniref:hypothetical protein n=1 Tax=Promicromonospora sp. NPDC023805 TaxID=3154696 RepID=UPI003402E36C